MQESAHCHLFSYMYVMYVSLQVLKEVQILECPSQLFGGM